VIMAGVTADFLALAFERLDLGVDGEHLFHKSTPKVKQPHLERPFVLGSKADPAFLEEQSHVRLETHAVSRLPAAGSAGLNKHTVANLANACEPLDILETVVATEAANGLAFLLDKLQPRMLLDGLPKLLQLVVNRFLAQRRRKCSWIEENVDVFRKPLDQVPTLGQARAALEDYFVAGGLLDDTQRLRNEIVFFDERLAQATRTEVLRRADDGLLELRVLK